MCVAIKLNLLDSRFRKLKKIFLFLDVLPVLKNDQTNHNECVMRVLMWFYISIFNFKIIEQLFIIYAIFLTEKKNQENI